MAVPPLVALQAAGKASKSLTGDIYTRTTSKVVGKGKKAQVVDSTLHINPVTVGVGLAATAVGVGLAAWILQLKLAPVKVQQMVTVIDQKAEDIPAEGYWVEATGHYEATGEGIIKGRGYSAGAFRWVEDTPRRWVETFPAHHHNEISHQEPTGKTVKRFSIEQRQGFSISDLLPNPIDMVGAGRQASADALVPTYLRWAAPWTWGTKGKWL
jgi:hypothetical protein